MWLVKMSKKIRMAVIGAGGMGMHTSLLYSRCPDLEISAFCDTMPGRAEEAAAQFNRETGGHALAFSSRKAMAEGCAYEAAYIACPPDIQVEIACLEMERGVHVMTQVPAAFTIDECWALVNTAAKTGVAYVLAEQTRYWDFIRRWRRMSKEGSFGKIVYAEGAYLHYEPQWDFFTDEKTGAPVVTADAIYHGNPRYGRRWRYGVFAEPILYLPHTLGPLLSITGGRISKVACFGTRVGGYCYEGFQVCDLQEAVMYNTEDIVFSVKAGFTTPHGFNPLTGAHWYQIKGTESSVEIPRSTLDCGKLWTKEGDWEGADWSCVPEDADEFTRSVSHGGADMEPILQFIRAINKAAAPETDVYTAVESAAPAILAAESCRMGGALLEVPDFRNFKKQKNGGT